MFLESIQISRSKSILNCTITNINMNLTLYEEAKTIEIYLEVSLELIFIRIYVN